MQFSIITINYNNAEGLEKTIKSVKSQTYSNFEHIIIDGNSKDGSKTVIESHKDFFSYSISEPDTGIYNAMNKGIKVSKGKYLLFLNSGDKLYDHQILDKVSKKMFENLDIYYGDLNLIFKKENKIQVFPKKLSFGFFYEKSLAHPSVFIKKNLFDDLFYYNESFKIISDWEFFTCAICKYNASYKHLGLIISKFNTDGISSRLESYQAIMNFWKRNLRP